MNTDLITDHLDLWTSAVTYNRAEPELTGIAKLRELILTLGFSGKLIKSGEGCWKEFKLSEVGTWGSGGTPSKSDKEYFGGDIPWLLIGDLNDGVVESYQHTITRRGLDNSSAKIIPPGTLLIAMYGSIGKLGKTGMHCATNQAIAFCKPKEELVDLDYLFYFLMGKRSDLFSLGKGLAQKNISQKVLKSFQIALPPIPEQKRIVEKIKELMALCDRLEQQTSDQLSAHETLVDTLLDTLTRSQDATELADNWGRLAEHFDTLFTTEDSIDRLEQTILQLAVMGRLVPQEPID